VLGALFILGLLLPLVVADDAVVFAIAMSDKLLVAWAFRDQLCKPRQEMRAAKWAAQTVAPIVED